MIILNFMFQLVNYKDHSSRESNKPEGRMTELHSLSLHIIKFQFTRREFNSRAIPSIILSLQCWVSACRLNTAVEAWVRI